MTGDGKCSTVSTSRSADFKVWHGWILAGLRLPFRMSFTDTGGSGTDVNAEEVVLKSLGERD